MRRKRKGFEDGEGNVDGEKRPKDGSDTDFAEAKEQTLSDGYSTAIREQIVKMTTDRGVEKTC